MNWTRINLTFDWSVVVLPQFRRQGTASSTTAPALEINLTTNEPPEQRNKRRSATSTPIDVKLKLLNSADVKVCHHRMTVNLSSSNVKGHSSKVSSLTVSALCFSSSSSSEAKLILRACKKIAIVIVSFRTESYSLVMATHVYQFNWQGQRLFTVKSIEIKLFFSINCK